MALSFDRGGRSDGSSVPGFPTPVPPDSRPAGLTYEPFYGLREKPFSLTSDARFFYQSRAHAPAFDDLLNAIRRRESLNVLTGDVGTGKTTLCRAVLQSLDRKTFSALVPDPFASREELLKVLLTDFGVASIDDVTSGRLRHATRTELSYLLYEFLSTLAPLQAFAVVFIDEAQCLSHQLLEEVRILSDADGQLQVVLVGQLELRERLEQPDMRQLEQRVSVHSQLQPLDAAGVAGYIAHRLHIARGGADRVRFTDEAAEAVYQLSAGVPRVINRLCDRALRNGYLKKAAEIDAGMVQAANSPTVHKPLTPSAATRTSSNPMVVPVVAAGLSEFMPEPSRTVAPPAAAAVPATPTAGVVTVAAAAPAAVVTAPADGSAVTSEPPVVTATPTRPATPQLPERLEAWLTEIEKQPETPPVDHRVEDSSVSPSAVPAPGKRSGVRLRVQAPSNPQRYTHADRVRRRWTRRFFTTAVAMILLLGTIVLGPATVAASLDLWSQIDEQFTPPPEPVLPATPARAVPAMPVVTLPADLMAGDTR